MDNYSLGGSVVCSLDEWRRKAPDVVASLFCVARKMARGREGWKRHCVLRKNSDHFYSDDREDIAESLASANGGDGCWIQKRMLCPNSLGVRSTL